MTPFQPSRGSLDLSSNENTPEVETISPPPLPEQPAPPTFTSVVASDAFLLTRVLLDFGDAPEGISGELSAAALTPDGHLWVGSDEFRSVERLSPIEPYVYSDHRAFHLGDFIPLFNDDEEIDIEGMDYDNGYLWIIGSHSTKRRKPKGKNLEKDLSRLAEIKTELNRQILARIPVQDGELVQSCLAPDGSGDELHAGCLATSETGSMLMDLLEKDPHLGPFLKAGLPSKENGIDIEGLAVRDNRLFIGFRGPVLNGYALIMQMELHETERGILEPKRIGTDGAYYLKHFVDLNGLGVRELCVRGKDLLILAGPTMDLEGRLLLFRFKGARKLDTDSITTQDSGDLRVVFDLPFVRGADHAEGLVMYHGPGQKESLLVVYDAPHADRKLGKHAVYADVFRLD